MKLNPRERVMLILLGILIVFAASYFLVIRPQLDRIDLLTEEEKNVMSEIDRIKADLAAGDVIDQDTDKVYNEIEEITKVFYPAILKERIIVDLDTLIKETQIKNKSMAIGKASVEQIRLISSQSPQSVYYISELALKYDQLHPKDESDESEALDAEEQRISNIDRELRKLEAVSIRFQLDGSYEQLISFISGIEAFNRSVVVTNLGMIGTQEENIVVNMEIFLYALAKIHDQDEDYMQWEYENVYGKDSPF